MLEVDEWLITEVTVRATKYVLLETCDTDQLMWAGTETGDLIKS